MNPYESPTAPKQKLPKQKLSIWRMLIMFCFGIGLGLVIYDRFYTVENFDKMDYVEERGKTLTVKDSRGKIHVFPIQGDHVYAPAIRVIIVENRGVMSNIPWTRHVYGEMY